MQPRKKLLFLITKSNWGGGQRYVYDLATSLNRGRYDIVVALGGTGELYQNLIKAGVRVIQIEGLQRDVSFSKELKASGAIARIIRAEKPDILHVNSSKAGAIGALLGRLFGVRLVVFTALGWAFNEDRPAWQKFLIKAVHWLTVLLAHKTIALSSGIKEQLDWPGAAQKMTIVHLGRHVSDVVEKMAARDALIAKAAERGTMASLAPYRDDVWLGSLSELHPIKQLDRAIDAVATLVKEFPRLRYIIIGEGQERQKLETKIEALALQEHVFPVGSIFEAGKLLGAFDLFLFPSRSEAFGYVLLEAGAAGIPVVSTKTGGITDVVIDGETGLLVDRESTEALTAAIRRYLTDTTLSSTHAKRHRERALTFTIDKMVKETEALYA